MSTPNFLDDYLLYTGGNEASPLFHAWGGLSALSAVVSRKVFFDQAYFKIYPNLYVILVGEPGDGKSTAMSLSKGMVQKLEMPIAPSSCTLQQISFLMSETQTDSCCHLKFINGTLPVQVTQFSFYADEIVVMLSAGGNPKALIEFFTTIYAVESHEVATKNKGTDLIVSPYVTMLACMTPEQTSALFKENLISGGFSRRGIFVWGKRHGTPVALPKQDTAREEARLRCLAHLQKVKKFFCQYRLASCGEAWFVPWYNAKFKMMGMPYSSVYKNWLRTKDTQLIKVAMLLDLAQDMTGVLTEDLFIRALRLLDDVEINLHRVLAGAGRNPLADLAYKLTVKLEEAPDNKLPKKQVIAALFDDGNLEEIDKAIDFLVRTDTIVKLLTPAPDLVEILALKPQNVQAG